MPLASVSPGMPATPESPNSRSEAGKADHTPDGNIGCQDTRRLVIDADLSRRPLSQKGVLLISSAIILSRSDVRCW
jgi:hypothetical protein